LPNYDGSNVKADRETYIPSWLSDHPDVKGAAAQADANTKLNDAASQKAFGGYHTPQGADDASASAGAQAADTQTSQNLMKQASDFSVPDDPEYTGMGGMGRSLPRKTWGVD